MITILICLRSRINYPIIRMFGLQLSPLEYNGMAHRLVAYRKHLIVELILIRRKEKE